MPDFAIQVEGISKRYVIDHFNSRSRGQRTLRDAITESFQGLGKQFSKSKPKDNFYSTKEEFWALRDVSLEIKQGERVGIIGRNGAGKSTMLKILSRIVEPTKGNIKLRGRVASLLEVGTGFHPELTGRENIYLNGAILGMSKSEIRRKFDEIVEFAEVSRFLDTPVKRYSSGMYVRLAFAVAAHLEPEILIIDEVLAVGDAQFQKKCLGKMEDVSQQEGRTVLFVSHSMAAIEKLCQRGIFLSQGTLKFIGSQTDAITEYMKAGAPDDNFLENYQARKGSGEIRFTKIEIRDEYGNVVDTVTSGQNISILLYYKKLTSNPVSRVQVSINVATQLGVPVFMTHNRMTGTDFGSVPEEGCFVCNIGRLPMPASIYQLSIYLMHNYGRGGQFYDIAENAYELTVIDGDFFGTGEVPPISHGVCLVDTQWSLD